MTDTRNRRAGGISAGRPWIVIMPVADGSIDAPDRQLLANAYPSFANEHDRKVLIGMTIVEYLTMMEFIPY